MFACARPRKKTGASGAENILSGTAAVGKGKIKIYNSTIKNR
jgi:hypothetical protein